MPCRSSFPSSRRRLFSRRFQTSSISNESSESERARAHPTNSSVGARQRVSSFFCKIDGALTHSLFCDVRPSSLRKITQEKGSVEYKLAQPRKIMGHVFFFFHVFSSPIFSTRGENTFWQQHFIFFSCVTVASPHVTPRTQGEREYRPRARYVYTRQRGDIGGGQTRGVWRVSGARVR